MKPKKPTRKPKKPWKASRRMMEKMTMQRRDLAKDAWGLMMP